MLISTPAEGYAACCGAIETWTSSPTCPASPRRRWSIAGLADEATPPAHARRIADGVPGAGWRWSPGPRTWPTSPARTLVTQLLVDFLSELARRRP